MKRIQRMLAVMLIAVLGLVGASTYKPMTSVASGMVTVYFYDNTSESWIGNDSAAMELVDNTYGHVHYTMEKQNGKVWSANIPASATNITFNRYNINKTTLWNSWSTGYRGTYTVFEAESASYGNWSNRTVVQGYNVGDTIFLDVSGFSSWMKDGAELYVEFINDGCSKIVKASTLIQDNLYTITVTPSQAGATTLRFWRGNDTTLWNSSIELSHDSYVTGYNCVKVTGWSNQGNISTLYYR